MSRIVKMSARGRLFIEKLNDKEVSVTVNTKFICRISIAELKSLISGDAKRKGDGPKQTMTKSPRAKPVKRNKGPETKPFTNTPYKSKSPLNEDKKDKDKK